MVVVQDYRGFRKLLIGQECEKGCCYRYFNPLSTDVNLTYCRAPIRGSEAVLLICIIV